MLELLIFPDPKNALRNFEHLAKMAKSQSAREYWDGLFLALSDKLKGR